MNIFLVLTLAASSVITAVFGNITHLPDALVSASVGALQSEKQSAYDTLALKHAAQPINTGQAILQINPTAAYAFDTATGQELYSKNADELRPIASITKLAAAMVIIRNHPLDKVVTIPVLPQYSPEEVTIGLQPGQKFTIKSLLAAALIPSANDAADALAIIDSGSIEAFVKKMNTIPVSWGISAVHFTNASGLDENNQASARAVGHIAALILQNNDIAELVARPTAAINDTAGKVYSLASTNALLPARRFTGVKTGYTPAAGQCFVGRVTIEGHSVITVVLGSTDRFGESDKLANWIEQNYTWVQL